MQVQTVKEITPQAASIYRLLLKSEGITAAKIGQELQIYPHSVYRAVKSLKEHGLVDESNEYPVTYFARSSEDALNVYLNKAREGFLESFFPMGTKPNTSSSQAANN